MIFGNKMTDLEKTLDAMEKSNISFYLTGSRFFKINRSDSDYDFFACQSPGHTQILQDLGFTRTSWIEYTEDRHIIEVWQHNGCDIHVQIVLDVNLKLIAQQFIAQYIEHVALVLLSNKAFWKVIWRIGYDHAESEAKK